MTVQPPARRLLAASALDAVERGFAVFPVSPMRKTPAVQDWERVATRDIDQVLSWYRARPFNLGVAAGPSGLVVVDLDVSRGEPAPEPWSGARNGREVFSRLAAAHSANPLPNTYAVSTPSGGVHLYFWAAQGTRLRNTVAKLGWCIDTRACGGYVVGAGSALAEGRYTVVNDADIAHLPAWLLIALTPPPAAAPSPAMLVSVSMLDPYVRAAVSYECADLRAPQVGTRNVQLHKAARSLGELVGAGRLSDQDARAALWDAAAGHIGVGGCTRREVAQTINSGLRFGQDHPRRLRMRGRSSTARSADRCQGAL